MDIQHAPRASTESRERHSSACVPGRWLLLTRGVWLALVVLTLAIFFASLPVYVALLQTPCAGMACALSQQLSPGQVGALKGIGLSLGDYAAYIVALTLASVVVCLVISTLIIWRRPDDRMALLVALLLVTFGPIIATNAVSVSPSPWRVPNDACCSGIQEFPGEQATSAGKAMQEHLSLSSWAHWLLSSAHDGKALGRNRLTL